MRVHIVLNSIESLTRPFPHYNDVRKVHLNKSNDNKNKKGKRTKKNEAVSTMQTEGEKARTTMFELLRKTVDRVCV